MNKTVKKYLIQLPIVGLIYFICGIITSAALFYGKIDHSIFYMPFITLGIVFAFWSVVHIDPGGTVNYYFGARKPTEDEQTLYDLVIKYRNRLFMNIAFILVFTAISITEINYLNSFFSINTAFFLLIWSFLTALVIGNGVKYISAWWNIKKSKNF